MDIPVKKRSDVKKLSATALGVELPENSKIFFSDAVDDFEPVCCLLHLQYHCFKRMYLSTMLEQVFRYLSGHRLLNPQWRSQRPYVMAQKVWQS